MLTESIICILLFQDEPNQTDPSRKLLMILNHYFEGKTLNDNKMLKSDLFVSFSLLPIVSSQADDMGCLI